jgi:hypothetical protein
MSLVLFQNNPSRKLGLNGSGVDTLWVHFHIESELLIFFFFKEQPDLNTLENNTMKPFSKISKP